MRDNPKPKSQLELSSGKEDKINRGRVISRSGDTVKDMSIGIYDIDNAIRYYFFEIIKPSYIDEDGQRHDVPILYGSPETWVSIRKGGFYRDKKGKVVVPLIIWTNTGINKSTDIVMNKLDANNPTLFYDVGRKWSPKNKYDNFSVLIAQSPMEEFYRVVMPNYVVLTYNCTIWTNFTAQINKIIESILYSEGSYWGEPDKFIFKAKIDDFSKSTEVSQGKDRAVKCTFTISINGYIIPDTINAALSLKENSNKAISYSKVNFGIEVDESIYTNSSQIEKK